MELLALETQTLLPAEHPRKFMFIVIQVDKHAFGNSRKTFRRFKIHISSADSSLHFNRADKFSAQARGNPLFDPVVESWWVTGKVAEKPVHGANVLWL